MTTKRFDKQAFFDALPKEPMTAKEAQKALENLMMANINVLPVEMRVRDMFELGVKIGRITETPDGKIFILRGP